MPGLPAPPVPSCFLFTKLLYWHLNIHRGQETAPSALPASRRLRFPGFKTQFCHFLAVQPKASDSTSLCLTFLFYTMIIKNSTYS